MITFDEITACLVTRGDVDLQPILDTLPYGHTIVWNNSTTMRDAKTAGRYNAALGCGANYVYFQDDDVIFTHHNELLAEFNKTPELLVANWGHGNDHAGFDDVALVCGGAITPVAPLRAAGFAYLAHFEPDDDFLADCDFAIGLLTPHRHIHLPYEIRECAYNPNRLAQQPWQREAKMRIANRARWIKNGCQPIYA